MTDPVRARADGKLAMRARIVWQLDAGPLAVRCVRNNSGFVVQGRSDKGWTEVLGEGTDAHKLLAQVCLTPAIGAALAEEGE
jgi:hypothetical protein